jgi:ArsR family transcriptional regulator
VCAEVARVLRPGGRLVVADMLPHAHEEYRQTMGHVWMGFSPAQVQRLLAGAGFDAVHVHALDPEPGVKGPALFVASAVRGNTVPSRQAAQRSENEALVTSASVEL